MASRVNTVAWTDVRRLNEMVKDSQAKGATYLAGTSESQSHLIEQLDSAVVQHAAADVVVIVDPASPARTEHFLALPPILTLIAALPIHDLAAAISVNSIATHPDITDRSNSLCEIVVRLAEKGKVAFVEGNRGTSNFQLSFPELTMPLGGARSSWLPEIIQRLGVPSASSTSLAALKAGLFLLNDFFDDSHACSQAIEGMGRYHSGDYWHAILHRREPDFGNAKYWFRHVGRHPAFDDLTRMVDQQIAVAAGTLATELKHWRNRLIPNGKWDPFAFVDLCAAAEDNAELKRWCARIQYEEMLILLEWTYREDAIER